MLFRSFAGSDIQGLVDVSVGDVWTAVVNGLTIVFADRQADIFPVLSQGERVLLVGVSDAGLLPEPGRVCGELLVVGDSDAQDAVFINEFPGRRGVESVTVVVAATDSVDAVLFGLYTNVYNQGLGIPMSIAVLDRGPVRERSAAREFASPTLNSDVSSVLMRDGQAFGLFEGDNRLVSDEVVVELHGDVVRTVALSPTSGIDVSLRDNRFWLERTAYAFEQRQAIPGSDAGGPVWSWSRPVSHQQSIMGSIAVQVLFERSLSGVTVAREDVSTGSPGRLDVQEGGGAPIPRIEGGVEGGGTLGEELTRTVTVPNMHTVQAADVRVKRPVSPEYPDAARRMDLGYVECPVEVYVDESGSPYDVELGGCPAVFHDNARTALMRSRWYPHRVNGQKVAGVVVKHSRTDRKSVV